MVAALSWEAIAGYDAQEISQQPWSPRWPSGGGLASGGATGWVDEGEGGVDCGITIVVVER